MQIAPHLDRLADHRGYILLGLGIVIDLVVETAPLCDRDRRVAIAQHLLAHALGHRRQNLFGDIGTRARGLAPDLGEVANVLSVFDLPQRAAPVRVVRAELLLQSCEPVPHSGVANVDLRQVAQLALDIAVDVRRRLLLDAEKVLLVERLEPVEGLINRREQLLDRFG